MYIHPFKYVCVLIVKHNHFDTVVEKHYIAQIRVIENEPTVSKRKGRGGNLKEWEERQCYEHKTGEDK